MSEYQYCEFAAIDRPLTAAEMAQLRKVSTRGQVSASSFVNHYEWGGLKVDPADWMRRYFDAFVYAAKWCSCRLFRDGPPKFTPAVGEAVDFNGVHWRAVPDERRRHA